MPPPGTPRGGIVIYRLEPPTSGSPVTRSTRRSAHHLTHDEAAYSHRTRPRPTLGWMTPSVKLAEVLQSPPKAGADTGG